MSYSVGVNYEEALAQLIVLLDELPHGQRKHVAAEAGVTPGYVTHIIKGRKKPTPELQSKLLKAMKYQEHVEFIKTEATA